MEELVDAINTTFAANTTLAASLSGGLYFSEAVQNASTPYGVYFFNNSIPDSYMPFSTLTNLVEEYAVQFNIWDDTRNRATITGIEADMRAAYDDITMTIVNHNNIFTTWESGRIIRDEEKRWQLILNYRIRVQRTA